jgi:hypothetical protein
MMVCVRRIPIGLHRLPNGLLLWRNESVGHSYEWIDGYCIVTEYKGRKYNFYNEKTKTQYKMYVRIGP